MFSFQSDRCQILEPVLRLDELLDLRRQCMRVGVMYHPHQHGVIDDRGMRLRQQFILPGAIKGLFGFVDQRIDFRIFVAAQLTPTGAIWPEWKKRTMA